MLNIKKTNIYFFKFDLNNEVYCTKIVPLIQKLVIVFNISLVTLVEVCAYNNKQRNSRLPTVLCVSNQIQPVPGLSKIMDSPVVNAWTEFGNLEYVCVGSVEGAHYPDKDPANPLNRFTDKEFAKYMQLPLGPKPSDRIRKAEAELENLIQILEGETITVGNWKEADADIKLEMDRKRSSILENPKNMDQDGRITVKKESIKTIRPPASKFDHLLITPWFKNYYQFGHPCPRDVLITFGNTILETPTASRVRYFESKYHRLNFYSWWKNDPRIHWKTAPQPTCGDTLYDTNVVIQSPDSPTFSYRTPLNDSEVAFDAADIMRCGKDVFYKKSETANNQGIFWLRKEFPELRFHMLHFPSDVTAHIDVDIAFLRPPTPGSEGIIMLNQLRPPLQSEMELFTENNWKPVWCPLPATMSVVPVAACSPNLNLNLLSLSPKLVVIEECEVELYKYLDNLGWDVITAPLRTLNEFGGGVHCVTWDIRRRDSCKDYFPVQDYDAELKLDLENFNDKVCYEELQLRLPN